MRRSQRGARAIMAVEVSTEQGAGYFAPHVFMFSKITFNFLESSIPCLIRVFLDLGLISVGQFASGMNMMIACSA